MKQRSLRMTSAVLNVPDISCEHCQRTITNALSPITGVQGVTVDIPAKQVTVEYDPSVVNVDTFKTVLQEEDYPVESVDGRW
jgi:copper chaperone